MGLFLFGSNLSARELDHIHNELESIQERIQERLTGRIQQRLKNEVRARVRHKVEDSIDETIADQVTEKISSAQQLPNIPRPDQTPTEQTNVQEPRARLRTPDIFTSDIIDWILESRIESVEHAVELALETVVDSEGNA